MLLQKQEDYEDYESKLDFDKINLSETIVQYESPFNLTKDLKERRIKKRNIVAATQDGVAINSESYFQRKNTGSRQRLLQKTYVTSVPARPSSFG